MKHSVKIAELWADGAIHGAAVAFSITATVLTFGIWAPDQSLPLMIAVGLYWGILIFSFTVSGIYNLWPFRTLREPLRRVDHAAIYLKIAGTYTPLAVILEAVLGYVILGVVWAVALAGALGKLAIRHWPKGLNIGLTLGLGRAAVFLLWPLAQTVPLISLGFIVLGGLLYTGGTYFYLSENLRYHTAIWHFSC